MKFELFQIVTPADGSTDPAILDKSSELDVRYMLAQNPDTPPEILKQIFRVETDSEESNDNWIQEFENGIINSLSDKERDVYGINK
jgi:hypothetical protein